MSHESYAMNWAIIIVNWVTKLSLLFILSHTNFGFISSCVIILLFRVTIGGGATIGGCVNVAGFL
jgi:hypothetical protein